MTKIAVTKNHIKQGIRGDCHNCPVSLAVKEYFGAKRVTAFTGYINIDWESYHSPRSVQRFIDRFDKNKKVKSFAFILRKL